MDLGLQGRKALVCGASKGLGYGVAEALLREGAEVMLNARNDQVLESAAHKLHAATGRRAVWCAADLTSAEDRARPAARQPDADDARLHRREVAPRRPESRPARAPLHLLLGPEPTVRGTRVISLLQNERSSTRMTGFRAAWAGPPPPA